MIGRRNLLALPLLAGCAADRTPLATASHGPDEGGIGGTGIFGLVGPGPGLVVAGIPLDPAGQQLPPAGEVVAVHATARDGRLVATRIARFQPLVGPVRHGADGSLSVLGTRVVRRPDTVLRGPGRLGAAGRIAVSGFWTGAVLRATAIAPDAHGQAVRLQGQLRAEAGRFLVGGTVLPAERLPDPPPLDRHVVVRGRAGAAGPLVVEVVEVTPPPPLDPPPSGPAPGRLAVEAVLARDATGPGLHLSGFGLPVAPDSLGALPVGPRLLLLGTHDGRFHVADAVPLPDAREARARRLADPATQAAIRRWQGV